MLQSRPNSSRLASTLNYTKQQRKNNTEAARALFTIGKQHHAIKEYTTAVQYYTKATFEDHYYVQAFCNLGSCLKALMQTQKARQAYLSALLISPTDSVTLYNLANLERIMGNFEEAVSLYKRVLAGMPNDRVKIDSEVNLGLTYQLMDNIEAAIENYELLIGRQQTPDEACYMNCSLCYIKLIKLTDVSNFCRLRVDRCQKARKLLEEVVRKWPANIYAQAKLIELDYLEDLSEEALNKALKGYNRIQENNSSMSPELKIYIQSSIQACQSLLAGIVQSNKNQANPGDFTRKTMTKMLSDSQKQLQMTHDAKRHIVTVNSHDSKQRQFKKKKPKDPNNPIKARQEKPQIVKALASDKNHNNSIEGQNLQSKPQGNSNSKKNVLGLLINEINQTNLKSNISNQQKKQDLQANQNNSRKNLISPMSIKSDNQSDGLSKISEESDELGLLGFRRISSAMSSTGLSKEPEQSLDEMVAMVGKGKFRQAMIEIMRIKDTHKRLHYTFRVCGTQIRLKAQKHVIELLVSIYKNEIHLSNNVRFEQFSLEMHCVIAEALSLAGRPEDALKHYQVVKDRLQSKNNVDLAQQLKLYDEMGTSYKQTGRTEQAIAYYRSCLQIEPQNVPVLFNLANCFGQLQQLPEAVKILSELKVILMAKEKTVSTQVALVECQVHMFLFMDGHQDEKQVLDECLAAIQILSSHQKEQYLQAELMLAFYLGAADFYEGLVQSNVNITPFAREVSTLFSIYQELLKYKSCPDRDALIISCGNILFRRECFYSSLSFFKQLKSLTPLLHNTVAIAYLHVGQPEKSLIYLQQALEMAPDNQVFFLNYELLSWVYGVEGQVHSQLDREFECECEANLKVRLHYGKQLFDWVTGHEHQFKPEDRFDDMLAKAIESIQKKADKPMVKYMLKTLTHKCYKVTRLDKQQSETVLDALQNASKISQDELACIVRKLPHFPHCGYLINYILSSHAIMADATVRAQGRSLLKQHFFTGNRLVCLRSTLNNLPILPNSVTLTVPSIESLRLNQALHALKLYYCELQQRCAAVYSHLKNLYYKSNNFTCLMEKASAFPVCPIGQRCTQCFIKSIRLLDSVFELGLSLPFSHQDLSLIRSNIFKDYEDLFNNCIRNTTKVVGTQLTFNANQAVPLNLVCRWDDAANLIGFLASVNPELGKKADNIILMETRGSESYDYAPQPQNRSVSLNKIVTPVLHIFVNNCVNLYCILDTTNKVKANAGLTSTTIQHTTHGFDPIPLYYEESSTFPQGRVSYAVMKMPTNQEFQLSDYITIDQ